MINQILFHVLKIRMLRNRKITGTAFRINNLMKFSGGDSYLEIGVNYGYTFESVEAKQKVGVDPLRKVITSGESKFLKMTSDEFFAKNKMKFNFIFIDGLHEYYQVTRDIFNSLNCLEPGGLVLIDDVVPSHNKEASLEWRKLTKKQKKLIKHGKFSWQGDVYKAISLLTNEYKRYLNFATIVDDNHFQTVIWKKHRKSEVLSLSEKLLENYDSQHIRGKLIFNIPKRWRPMRLVELMQKLDHKNHVV